MTEEDTIYEIRYDFDLAGGSVTIPSGCVLNFIGGKLSNGTLTGDGTSVKTYSRENAIFRGITFAGTWIDSDLTALNFGFVSDLSYSQYTFNYKGVVAETEKAQGTDNATAAASLSSFLTNAKFIRIEFNGDFFFLNSVYIDITNCDNCEICGGTLLCCLSVLYSRNIDIHDINFVGFHKPHELPKLAYLAENIAPDVFHPNEGFENLGIVNGACVFINTSVIYTTKYNEFVNVHDCKFEMHTNGVMIGKSMLAAFNRNCVVKNCSFDTIYYQPIGFHGENCYAENIAGRYCGQAIDFSSFAHNCSATNVIAKDGFGTGIKTDSSEEGRDYTFGNVADNCEIEIVNTLHVDTQAYAISCNGDRNGKIVMSVRNSRFLVSGRNPSYTGIETGLNILSNCIVHNSVFNLGTGFDYGISVAENMSLNLFNVDIKIGSTSSYAMRGYPNARLYAKGCRFENTDVGTNRFIGSTENLNGFVAEFTNCALKKYYQVLARASKVYFKDCDIDVADMSGTSAFNQGTSSKIIYSFIGCNIKVADLLVNASTSFWGDVIFVGNNIEFKRILMTGETDTNLRTLIMRNNIVAVKQSMPFIIPNALLSENSDISGNLFFASGVTNPWIVDFGSVDKRNSFFEMAQNNTYVGIGNPQFNISAYRATSLTSKKTGYIFFDKTLGKPLVWGGTTWVNMDGTAL